ncbi:unnamed protein product, partial [Amoebophrya sp. A25]
VHSADEERALRCLQDRDLPELDRQRRELYLRENTARAVAREIDRPEPPTSYVRFQDGLDEK